MIEKQKTGKKIGISILIIECFCHLRIHRMVEQYRES